MNIPFIKMQGAGNDFVILSPLLGPIPFRKLTKNNLKLIGNRHYGVGADQILIVNSSDNAEDEYEFEIINSDGNEVEQCGNGARCVMRFLFDLGLISGNQARLRTKAGIVKASILDNSNISVQMTIPKLTAIDIGLNINLIESKFINKHEVFFIPWKDRKIKIFPVSMGNPHAVTIVKSTREPEIEEMALFINDSGFFVNGINLGFCKIFDKKRIELRVFERGSGETLACGSGACAAVVACIAQGLLSQNEIIEVHLPGGKLSISWTGNLKDSVYMSGPAEEVFKGTIKL
jgi:diaminopimelate epimerase